MAELTERLHGLAAAVPLYREVLALDPAHAGAHFAVGRTLLEANEAEGLGHLDRAMAGSCDLIIPACITAAAYLRAAGRDIEARRYDERARERQALLAAAQAERSVLRASDDLIPHGLDEAALATILAQLRASPCIKAAYLARKKLAHFPEQPLYVVGVIVRLGIWRRERRRRRLIDRAARELRMPSRFIIVPMTWRNRRFARKLRPARIAPPRT
jgi:hypothetical protein